MRLREAERERFGALIQNGKHRVRPLLTDRILLKADASETDTGL